MTYRLISNNQVSLKDYENSRIEDFCEPNQMIWVDCFIMSEVYKKIGKLDQIKLDRTQWYANYCKYKNNLNT